MITVLNEKAIAIQIPEGAINFGIDRRSLLFTNKQKEDPYPVGLDDIDGVDLPEGNWSILGRPEEIKEEQWKQITPRMDGDLAWIPSYNDPDSGGHSYCYEDFENEDERAVYYTATESGLSLVKSKNIDSSKVIILIKKQ